MRPTSLLGLALTVSGIALGACGSDGSADLDVRARAMVGRRLQLVVETSRHYRPFLSHSSQTADAKGWLVLIDLGSDGPIGARTRVLGPLWDVADARSFVGFNAGAIFTSADALVARATPAHAFDPEGALLRFSWDAARRTGVLDRLELGPNGGRWMRQGQVRPIDDRTPPFSEDRLESPSGRHVLLRQDGVVRLFDQFSGEERQDAWLTSAFAHARSIPRFESVRYFLTEDLKHLVVNPVAVWNDGGDGVRTFELNGRTYQRAETVLAYSRPDASPTIATRPPDSGRGYHDEPPNDAFTIDGQLRLFDSGAGWLRLYGVDGRSEVRAEDDGSQPWPLGGGVMHTQHRATAGEIVLWDHGDIVSRSVEETRLYLERLAIWNYRTGAVERFTVRLADLFAMNGTELQPRASRPLTEVK